MGIKLAELPAGNRITLVISNGTQKMELPANIDRSIRDNISVINLEINTTQPIKFEGVQIEVEANFGEVPYIWRTAQILYYQNEYILQVKGEGARHNRRNSFRVGVSRNATMRMDGRKDSDVMVRDVSLSGFSIGDRKKELNLKMGDSVVIYFEDIGHHLNLAGQVVRIDEREDIIIYGFVIHNLCKDLSSYIPIKQRRNNATAEKDVRNG